MQKRGAKIMFKPHHVYHRSSRFYVVAITLLVAGIFLFLFMNNGNTEGISLTSAFMSEDVNSEKVVTEENVETSTEKEDDILSTITSSVKEKATEYKDTEKDSSKEKEESETKTTNRDYNKVDLELDFDQIPEVKKEAKLDIIEISFEDLTSKININEEKLELNNLDEVSLTILAFEGDIDFNQLGVSLDGTAESLEINGIALSSHKEIEISFNGLDYNILNINNLELKEIELPTGDGELSSEEDRLTYRLIDDEVNIYSFKGELEINKDSEIQTKLSGFAEGIDVAGDYLNLNLR